jgi:predicted AlkP superfamily pyrophosphatase or phosphodiesterase
MLPAPSAGRVSLADVLRSCLDSTGGQANRLGLPAVRSAIVLLVDGLGADVLRAREGHARTLAGELGRATTIETGVPTTTASAIASLTTGVLPGQHGLVGYTVLDAVHDRIVNQLSGWDDRLDPATWQLQPTLFETAGIKSYAVGPERYRDSGLSRAVLRGAEYRGASTILTRLELAVRLARATPSLIYVYAPELDQACHAYGWQSTQWTDALEQLDAGMRTVLPSLGTAVGLVLTADHGVLDVPHHAHVLFDAVPELVAGVRFVAGEPRMLHLHLEPDADAGQLAAAWRNSEADRAWIATRTEAIEAGWYGPVLPEVAPRIGDLLVAARKAVAYYDDRDATRHGRTMIGQHGSWSAAETRVPLLRFGAYS